MRRSGVIGLLAAWGAAFAASLAVRLVVTPVGDGFTRGMNVLGWLVAFQLLALGLAVAAFAVSRRLPPGDRLRRWAWGPLILAGLFLAAMALPFIIGG